MHAISITFMGVITSAREWIRENICLRGNIAFPVLPERRQMPFQIKMAMIGIGTLLKVR